jgi:hypothetical protein
MYLAVEKHKIIVKYLNAIIIDAVKLTPYLYSDISKTY